LNRFWPYSGSWHVAVDYDEEHTMHGLDVLGAGVRKTRRFFIGKKVIFDAHLGNKPTVRIYMSLNSFLQT
jgi:hypothetical protein